ncbi:MAG: SDR family NAD(P)-dependent oxidoreductase [Cyclobacteriaceae bacterium]|nr:SDR family NAD(P)-dependent oxidoreductase [Cyclobacteriaceae bacterium SS2]
MSAFDFHAVPSKKGKLAIVTGANTGLGYYTALGLAQKDFEVVLACRNLEKAEKAKESIKEIYPDAKLKCLEIDLGKQSSVRAFVKQFFLHYKQLDLLVNNAGIMMTPYEITEDGFEGQLATNYLGHFTLTALLLETLEKTKDSRIVMVSSLSHRRGEIRFDDLHFKHGYKEFEAYAQSKLACLMFAYQLDKKLRAKGYQIKALAAHPGITITELIDHFNPIVKSMARVVAPLLFSPTDKAALPILRAAVDPQVSGGEYYGPNGFREYKGAPTRVASSKSSKDPRAQEKLWELSEQLTRNKLLE